MEVGEHDDLAPLPLFSPTTSPKRLRPYRAVSSPAVVQVQSRVVPTPGPDQIISTLIDSLTAISQTARDRLRAELDVPDHKLDAYHDEEYEEDYFPSPNEIHADSSFGHPPIPAPGDDDEDSDDEAAAAPVIRFSRAPPPPPIPKKHSRRPQTSHSSNAMLSERGLIARKSTQSLRSQEPSSHASSEPMVKDNPSFTSLAISVLSARNRSGKNSPVRSPRKQSPVRPSPERTYSDSVVPLDRTTPEHDAMSMRSVDESHTSSTLSPLNREKLEEHLIPSRQSSIRSAVRRGHHRHSTGSRDLKDLHIDEELISSDNSTVRRIKELQEAKEKRHSEWRKESTSNSDISAKRHSAPSPKALRRSSTYQSSKLSVTEVLVESEHEGPQLSAQISAADLALMPAMVNNDSNSPLTPVGGHSQSPSVGTPSVSIPISVPTLSAPVPPRDRTTSMPSKRVSMIAPKDSRTDDIRTIHDEVEAFLSASRLTQKLRHPRTGRTIAFSEVGDPKGFVVVCCVGMGLTRYAMSFYDELARTLKLRLITPDRPGVGESEPTPERLNNPMTWVDDVAVICEALDITRFSLLAHSAGTIYAMATALKMPQYVRGRIHLLAPWIPPSQMLSTPASGPDAQPIANLPMSHRILSVLPTSMLKVANSRFLSATSASVDTRPSAAKKSKQLDLLENELSQTYAELKNAPFSPPPELDRTQLFRNIENGSSARNSTSSPEPRASTTSRSSRPTSARLATDARATLYNTQLTHRIWTLATLNANPAADLLTCLERKKPIGFRYADVTRSIVIRHGAKDTRVPLDNVKWLDSVMKRSELRILENEGHSLMANASVMSSVLGEISREWDEWDKIARYKDKKKRETTAGNHVNGSGSASVRSGRR